MRPCYIQILGRMARRTEQERVTNAIQHLIVTEQSLPAWVAEIARTVQITLVTHGF